MAQVTSIVDASTVIRAIASTSTQQNDSLFYYRTCARLVADYSSDPANPALSFLHGSNATYPVVDMATCRAFCGTRTHAFPDSVPRINTWLFPVFILLTSLHYSNTNVEAPRMTQFGRFLKAGLRAIAHVLGDPAHYTYAMLCRGELWKRHVARARKLTAEYPLSAGVSVQAAEIEIFRRAGVLAVFDRIRDCVIDVAENRPQQNDAQIAQGLNLKGSEALAIKFMLETDCTIAEQSGHVVPACTTVFFYVWQVTGAFVPEIGQTPNPSGGRVAHALLLSWIVFQVLCSNTVGGLTCTKEGACALQTFLQREFPIRSDDFWNQMIRRSFDSTYYTGHLNGEQFDRTHIPRCRRNLLKALAMLPIWCALGFSVAATTVPPTYFNTRLAVPLSYGFVYLAISPLTTRMRSARLTYLKNAAIAVLSIAILIVTSCGLFYNNCRGWFTYYPAHRRGIALNSTRAFDVTDHILFPIMVSLCIGMQLGFWLLMTRVMSPEVPLQQHLTVPIVSYEPEAGGGSNASPHLAVAHGEPRDQFEARGLRAESVELSPLDTTLSTPHAALLEPAEVSRVTSA